MLMRPDLSNLYHLRTTSFSCLARGMGRLILSGGVAALDGAELVSAGAFIRPDGGHNFPFVAKAPLLSADGTLDCRGRREDAPSVGPVVASALLALPSLPLGVRTLLDTAFGLDPLCSSGLDEERTIGFPSAEISRLDPVLARLGESCLCRRDTVFGALPGPPRGLLLG